MAHYYMRDKVTDKIKEIIGIGKCDYTKILINADDKLPDITLKNVVILVTCYIKYDDK